MSAAATAIAASLVRAAKECCDGSCSSACKQQPAPGYERCAGGFDVLPGQVHPWHQPAMPSHEAFQQAFTRPVVVTANPMVGSQVLNGSANSQQHLPINQGPISIKSDLFEGVMEIHLRGLPNTQQQLFEGKKRFFQVMCQGRFTRPVTASHLCMGQEFVKPGNAPQWLGELVFKAAAKVFSNSTQVDAYAELPYFMNPLLAACQLVNVSQPGAEPQLTAAQEDMRLFSPALADKDGQPLCPAKRRKWCDVAKNLDGMMLNPNHVYTFHIWQHLIDFSTYKLSVGSFINIDLAAVLNGQPLQLTVIDTKEKSYLFSMLVWHERLLYGSSSDSSSSEHQTAMQQISERISHLGANVCSMLSGRL